MAPPPAAIAARWAPMGAEGMEHLTLTSDADGFHARGVVIGGGSGAGWGLHYAIDCGPEWTARRVVLARTDGRAMTLLADGAGRWRDSSGAPLPALDGCIDVDLAATPFTNTLPIRRLGLDAPGRQADVRVAYLSADLADPVAEGQRYACIGPGRFRFEALDGTFAAEIAVDAYGLVTDYPPLFRRLC